jgi:hypothetical protein
MNSVSIDPPKLSINPLTIHVVDQSTQIVDRSTLNKWKICVDSVSIDPPKKSIDRLSAENKFMHRITWDFIFNTKSPQIFFSAVGYDHFRMIWAVHFTI